MPGNAFGTLFRIVTFGESHGPALGAVIDGCPPGIALAVADFLPELARRRPGQSDITTSRDEPDLPEILSGLFEGKTTGMPITVVVRNVDQRPEEYATSARNPRPGHAETAYCAKYGIHDYRGGGRASGRETVARIIGGVIARKLLPAQTRITGHALEIAGIRAAHFDTAVIDTNPVRCADADAARAMVERLTRLKAEGDSSGGIVEIRIEHPPIGLGEPVFDKLKADLAKACMSIGAVMGVEFGAGFAAARMTGMAMATDPLTFGGILGGISFGDPIQLRLAVKPTSTTGAAARGGRHDPCVVPRMIPVAEAMVAIVLADHWLRLRAIRGDVTLEQNAVSGVEYL